jgi:hypothetical protein
MFSTYVDFNWGQTQQCCRTWVTCRRNR